MKFEEAKAQFIQAWGTLASKWGINRTMAQIHALLMIAPEPLSSEEIMEGLNISRGNVNMNVRELMDWGLVDKVIKPGERKEFFSAEKDVWKIATQVAKERKKRELEPVLKVLDQISHIEDGQGSKEVKTFQETIDGIKKVASFADNTLDTMIKAEQNIFFSQLLKVFK